MALPRQETDPTRVILVIGGSSGIGKAAVGLLNATGWFTINIDRRPDEMAPAERHHFVEVDIGNEAGVTAAMKGIAERFRDLQGVAVLAGIGSREGPEPGPRHFEEQIAANLTWQYRALYLALPMVVDGGAIVLTSSTTILYGETDLGYAAAKAGILGLGKGLALSLARRKIRVNLIAPGPIDTPLLRQVTTGAERAMLRTCTPLGKLGEPKNVASVVLFLLSEGAAHITGQTLVVDGGLSIAYRPVL